MKRGLGYEIEQQLQNAVHAIRTLCVLRQWLALKFVAWCDWVSKSCIKIRTMYWSISTFLLSFVRKTGRVRITSSVFNREMISLWHTMDYFQSGLTTLWRQKKKKKRNCVLRSQVMSGISTFPSVTHGQLIKWFTCLVTGSEWQTTSQNGLLDLLKFDRLAGSSAAAAACFFFFVSLQYGGPNSRRLTCQSKLVRHFFFSLFASFASNACERLSVSPCVNRSAGFLPAFRFFYHFYFIHFFWSGDVDFWTCSQYTPPHFRPSVGAIVRPSRQPRWLWTKRPLSPLWIKLQLKM